MITKAQAVEAILLVQDYFEQFRTGRFDRGDHEIYNSEIDEAIKASSNVESKIRNQVKLEGL
jgi:hypothetical protein